MVSDNWAMLFALVAFTLGITFGAMGGYSQGIDDNDVQIRPAIPWRVP